MNNLDIVEKKQFPEIYEYEESREVLIVNSKSESKVLARREWNLPYSMVLLRCI